MSFPACLFNVMNVAVSVFLHSSSKRSGRRAGQKGQEKKDLCTLPCGSLGRSSEARAEATSHPETETRSQWACHLQDGS